MRKQVLLSHRHNFSRVSIPTEELREFVADDESAGQRILYPRDRSLDPQLVWKGKDGQDAEDLALPAVPIYIQEMIHRQAIVEELKGEAAAPRNGGQEETPDLFGDFNGIGDDFEKEIDFYNHDSADKPHWSNRIVLGDSLLLLTSLSEKDGQMGKVNTIYMDPPYGIKLGSTWQDF